MAGSLLRYAGKENPELCEFVVDSESELADLPSTTKIGTGIFENNPSFDSFAPIGSVCIVGNEGGDLLIYMLFSFGWKLLD